MTIKARHKMNSFMRFKPITRAHLYYDYSKPDLDSNIRWEIAGGISFYYGSLEDDFWVHVPNGYSYAGPIVPAFLRRRISPDHPVFKAGIIHEYLRNKTWVRYKGVRMQANQEDADTIFLEAMKVSGVPWWQRKLYYIAAKLTPGFFSEKMGEQTSFDFSEYPESD